jgi:hypothetical protein
VVATHDGQVQVRIRIAVQIRQIDMAADVPAMGPTEGFFVVNNNKANKTYKYCTR